MGWDWLRGAILHLKVDLATLVVAGGALLSVLATLFLASQRMLDRMRPTHRRLSTAGISRWKAGLFTRISQELKSPTNALQAGLAELSRQPREDERRRLLEDVGDQARRLSRLTSTLRNLATLDVLELTASKLNLVEVVEEVAEAVRELPYVNEGNLKLTSRKTKIVIRGDRDLLFLALCLVVDNTLKAWGGSQPIELKVFRRWRRGCVAIQTVQREGRGSPPPVPGSDPTPRARDSSMPTCGIEMLLAKAIIERHGGEVVPLPNDQEPTPITLRLPLR